MFGSWRERFFFLIELDELLGKHSMILMESLMIFTTLVERQKSTLVIYFLWRALKLHWCLLTHLQHLLVLSILQMFFSQYFRGRTGRSQAKDRKHITSPADWKYVLLGPVLTLIFFPYNLNLNRLVYIKNWVSRGHQIVFQRYKQCGLVMHYSCIIQT